MDPAGDTTGMVGAVPAPPSWEDDEGEGPGQVEAAEIRRALGVESAFGFHVEGGGRRRETHRHNRHRIIALGPGSGSGSGRTSVAARTAGGAVLRSGSGVPDDMAGNAAGNATGPSDANRAAATSTATHPDANAKAGTPVIHVCETSGVAVTATPAATAATAAMRSERPIAPGGANRFNRSAFPCLDGHDYHGCLGAACPLETCWTGGATVSYARKLRDEAHVSTALYLPGAPCHTCAELIEDEVTIPAPRAIGQPGATRAALRGARTAAQPAHGEAVTKPEPGDEAERVTLHRVNCARGLWEHSISLSSFLMKRIPMRDQDEPELCPGYTRRPDPHPAVVAHLRQRRERARLHRLERHAAQDN